MGRDWWACPEGWGTQVHPYFSVTKHEFIIQAFCRLYMMLQWSVDKTAELEFYGRGGNLRHETFLMVIIRSLSHVTVRSKRQTKKHLA